MRTGDRQFKSGLKFNLLFTNINLSQNAAFAQAHMERPSEKVDAVCTELTGANLSLLNHQALERELSQDRVGVGVGMGMDQTLRRKSVTAQGPPAAASTYTSAWVRSVSCEQSSPQLPPPSALQGDEVGVAAAHRGGNAMAAATYSAAGHYRGLQTAAATSGSQAFNAPLLERQDSQQLLYERTDSQQQLLEGRSGSGMNLAGLVASEGQPLGLSLGAAAASCTGLVRAGSMGGWSSKVRDVTERVRNLDRLERLDHLQDVLARALVRTVCSSAQHPLPTALARALFDRALLPLVRELLHFGAELGEELSDGAEVRLGDVLYYCTASFVPTPEASHRCVTCRCDGRWRT